MKKLTTQQKIERAHVFVMGSTQFVGLSGILMTGDVFIEKDKEKCPTACTDGYNVWYGEEFINSLSDEEIRGVVIHENKHKMYRHTLTWRHLYKQSPILANLACDYVINGDIERAQCPGVKLPKGAAIDSVYSDGSKDAGEVFRLLCKKYPQLNSPDAVLVGNTGLPGGFDAHDWEAGDQWTEQEKQDISEKIDSAIRQGAILAGKVGADVDRDFGDLLKVKTDYKDIMRQFFTDACAGEDELSYRRPNRRFLQQDMIMPTYISDTLPHVVIGIDTSGSIGGDILTTFMSNVVQMLRQVNPEKIDLLYWDTKVARHESYEQGEVDKLLSSTKPAGGGGTSPQCVSRWLENNKVSPTVLVMLTDGWVDSWPTGINCPVLYCIYENPSACPPGAIIAHI